jgi:hypothetical protein
LYLFVCSTTISSTSSQIYYFSKYSPG